MENTLLTRLRRRVLFMISLPQTLEFEQDKEDIKECLHELRELNVDVCEHITCADLAKANEYDIVIVVAHHDTDNDTLVLADGTMNMSDFVNSLPPDYKGTLDFSSCYSASAYQAIKERCPQCRIQAALVEVRLLQRIIIYPSLVIRLYEDFEIDYHEAYKEVSMAFEEFASSERNGEDEMQMIQLGQQMSSIYAPSEIKLNTPFQILVFFHYDSEREIVKVKAQRWQTNATIRDDIDIPIKMKEGDIIVITLSFDSTDNTNIVVGNDEYKKHITLEKEMTSERFIVTVLPEFKGNGFLANIEMEKDGIPFVRCAFNIDISEHENKAPSEIVAEALQHPEKAEELVSCYSNIFTARLFGRDNYTKFHGILAKKSRDEEKLFFIRKILYNNNLFIENLNTVLKEKEEELARILAKDAKSSEITFELVPILKNYLLKLQKKLSTLGNRLLTIKKVKGKNIYFEEAVLRFSPIEWEYQGLSSDIQNLDFQIGMLKVLQELKAEIKDDKGTGNWDKDVIKDLVTQFLEYPHNNSVDRCLFDIFKESGTGSIIHNKSQGATMPFMALVLAMVEQEYTSIDKGKEGWFINVDKYLDYSNYKDSDKLRTPKNRINKLVRILDRKDVREKIKKYQTQEFGKISVTAYYLLKVKVNIV